MSLHTKHIPNLSNVSGVSKDNKHSDLRLHINGKMGFALLNFYVSWHYGLFCLARWIVSNKSVKQL